MIRTRTVRLLIPAILAVSSQTTALLHSAPVAAADGYELPVVFDHMSDHYTVNADGSYRQVSEVTLRILTPQGVSSFSAPHISYASSREEIESIGASITQPDGTVTRVPADAIRTQEESTDGGSTEFSDTKDKVILFPKVRVGSVLTWTYSTVVHTPVFPGVFSQTSTFPPYANVGHFELTVEMPAGRPLFIENRGVAGGLDHRTDTADVYQFSYSHPTNETPGEISVSDFDDADVLRFSTLSTPEDVARLYAQYALPKAEVTDRIRDLAARLTAGMTTDSDRSRVLYEWVSKNIRYVSVILGSGGYVPHAADEVLTKEYGDCKDHVTLLQALLKSAGIESVPALINLGDAYTLARIGSLSPFNHVINYLPSLNLYLDSTAQFAPFGTLPFEDADKPVLLTSLGTVGHTPRVTASSNVVEADIDFNIAADGRIDGTSKTHMTGSNEIDSRGARFDDRSTPADQVARRILSRVGETGSGSLDFVDPEDLGTPFWIKSQFSLDPMANMPGLGALKVPSGLSPGLLARTAAAKPSAKPQRHAWPCSSRTVHEHYTLNFPANVRITDIPPPTTYHDPQVSYESTYHRSGHTVEVDRRLVVERPSDSCPAIERDRWREFISVLQRDLRAQVFYR